MPREQTDRKRVNLLLTALRGLQTQIVKHTPEVPVADAIAGDGRHMILLDGLENPQGFSVSQAEALIDDLCDEINAA